MRIQIQRSARSLMLGLALASGFASAQTLDTKFACSGIGDDGGEKVTYADSGEIHLTGDTVKSFRWESALFRSTHGFDCDIGDEDGLRVKAHGAGVKTAWKVSLIDGRGAREKRGYNFDRGVNCSIDIARAGEQLTLLPNCPAMCGSRLNFSTIAIDLKSGVCHYETGAPKK